MRSTEERFRLLTSARTRYFTLEKPFVLENGETLHDTIVAYRTWGRQSTEAVLICHALTGSADVDAWWPGIIGSGKAFDPDVDFVICTNILGSCYGTTGPVSANPQTGRPYQATFPAITIRDMVRLQRVLLERLGVTRLSTVTGPSLGGMQALEWAAMYPDMVDSIVPIGVGGQHSAWCIAGNEAQRAAIKADPNWQSGLYSEETRPNAGLAAARMMAVCQYRSHASFAERFGRCERADDVFEVQSYLRHQGEKFVERFDANTYVTLTEAMHTHDLGRGRGDYNEMLGKIVQPALVVSVSSDGLYPPQEQEALVAGLGDAAHVTLDSLHGHDGFLIETAALSDMIRAFRSRGSGFQAKRAART